MRTSRGVCLGLALVLFAGNHAHAAWQDLEVESVKTDPIQPGTDVPVSIVVAVRNNGMNPVQNFSVSVSIEQSGRTAVIQKIPVRSQLPRGGSGLSVPVKIGRLLAGEYKATADIDPANQLLETNEFNNRGSAAFRVLDSRLSPL